MPLAIAISTAAAASPSTPSESTPREIAPFLKSLRAMLDHESDAVLRWTPDGRAFEIRDVALLTKEILPKYFKHAKYASFQRQLNYFHFRKWTKSRTEVCTFANPHFQRDEPHLSWCILRKRSLCDAKPAGAASPVDKTSSPPTPSMSSCSQSDGVSDDSASLCESPLGELDVALDWIDAVFPSLEMLHALGQDDSLSETAKRHHHALKSKTRVPRRRDAPMPSQSVEYVAW
jgi:hypothetical protein